MKTVFYAEMESHTFQPKVLLNLKPTICHNRVSWFYNICTPPSQFVSRSTAWKSAQTKVITVLGEIPTTPSYVLAVLIVRECHLLEFMETRVLNVYFGGNIYDHSSWILSSWILLFKLMGHGRFNFKYRRLIQVQVILEIVG